MLPRDFVAFDNSQIQTAWRQEITGAKSAPGFFVFKDGYLSDVTNFDANFVYNGTAYGSPRVLLILRPKRPFATLL